MPHANRSKKAENPARNPTPQEIRAARERAGLSQTEAAKLCFSTLRTWQNWEQEQGGESDGESDEPKKGVRMHPAIWAFWQSQAFPDDQVGEAFDAARKYIDMTLPFMKGKGVLYERQAAEAIKLMDAVETRGK
jgi:hypothetical protein